MGSVAIGLRSDLQVLQNPAVLKNRRQGCAGVMHMPMSRAVLFKVAKREGQPSVLWSQADGGLYSVRAFILKDRRCCNLINTEGTILDEISQS